MAKSEPCTHHDLGRLTMLLRVFSTWGSAVSTERIAIHRRHYGFSNMTVNTSLSINYRSSIFHVTAPSPCAKQGDGRVEDLRWPQTSLPGDFSNCI